MKIAVPIFLIPDLVEELTIDDSGKALDMTWARLIINEFDDHAIEQAILLKEKGGGEVIVVAFDAEDVDDVLFTAAAKGADQLIKLAGDVEEETNNHARARIFADKLKAIAPDLVLVGVQAHNDLDGQIAPLLAEYMGYPYIGYVAGVELDGGKVVTRKEYPGGLIAKMEATLPAVLGIQASEEPPRYVAFSKVRQAMKTAQIEDQEAGELDLAGGIEVGRMFEPEAAERATMIEGGAEEVSAKLIEIFKEQGAL
jgi:electron transfer flavoprotein beta subunit